VLALTALATVAAVLGGDVPAELAFAALTLAIVLRSADDCAAASTAVDDALRRTEPLR
jgi:hypothetical protein